MFLKILTLITVCTGFQYVIEKGDKHYRKSKEKKTTSIWTYKPPAKKKPRRLPGTHVDYNELLKEKLIKEGKYDSFNFDDEEDLEEDDYNYDDDK